MEVLINLRKMFKLKDFLCRRNEETKTRFACFDRLSDFNWRLASEAKKLNIPVFSYIHRQHGLGEKEGQKK